MFRNFRKTTNKTEKPKEEQSTSEKLFRSPQEQVHQAVREGKEDELMKLFFKGYDLSLTDQDGNNPLHIAAMNDHQQICRMLVIFAYPVELEKMPNKVGLLPENLAVSDKVRKDLRSLAGGEGVRINDAHTRCNDQFMADRTEWPENAKFLVAFDGGGIRGLIVTQILLHLESQLKSNIIERIDWLGGTSCGGLLALICTTGHSVAFARKFVLEQRNKVFCGGNSKMPKHDASGIEKISQGLWGDSRMDKITHPRVFVTVTDTRKTPTKLVLFRSYRPEVSAETRETHEFHDPSKILIWKAARCTSAAPYFFESFNGLADGGLTANNPTQALLTDFYTCNKLEQDERKQSMLISTKSEEEDDEPSVGCVLSVGTGVNPAVKHSGIDINFKQLNNRNPIRLAKNVMNAMNKAKTAFNMLVKECTSSNGTPLKYSREWCHSMEIPFFRFSPQLDSDVPLDCTDMKTIVDMLWQTEMYIRGEMAVELDQLARLLSMKQPHRPNETTLNSGASNSQRRTAVALNSVLKCVE